MFQVWLHEESNPHSVTGDEANVTDEGTLVISNEDRRLGYSLYAAGVWRIAIKQAGASASNQEV